MIVLSAFNWVPPFAQGLVRDLRVRWALEEAGWPYEERLLDLQSKNSPEYRNGNRSARSLRSKRTASRCSSRARSYCTSPSGRLR